MVSFYGEHLEKIKVSIKEILLNSGVKEFKWKKLDSAKMRLCGEKLIDLVFEKCCSDHMRVDILTWDTADYRHKIKRRDDVKNLQLMYFHLLRNVLVWRWTKECSWKIFPDENSALNWDILESFLTKHNSKIITEVDFLKKSSNKKSNFRIIGLKEVNSKDEVIIQVADLFAGLSNYSKNNYPKIIYWKKQQDRQLFFFDRDESIKLSCSDRERCPFLYNFLENCQKYDLGVHFNETSGLETQNPKKPINFWLYRSTSLKDNAPSKEVNTKWQKNNIT